MAKRTTIEGYLVTVFLPVNSLTNEKQALRDAQDVRDEIRRHVDLEPRVARDIDIEPQIDARCEYCGMIWTEKSDVYNGGCCDADEAARPHVSKVAP